MPALDFSVPHSLDPDAVVERLKGFIAKMRERNEPKFQVKSETWTGRKLDTSFTSFGFSMDATMQVEPSELKLHLNIPFAAIMFKGQIEQKLREEMTRQLAG